MWFVTRPLNMVINRYVNLPYCIVYSAVDTLWQRCIQGLTKVLLVYKWLHLILQLVDVFLWKEQNFPWHLEITLFCLLKWWGLVHWERKFREMFSCSLPAFISLAFSGHCGEFLVYNDVHMWLCWTGDLLHELSNDGAKDQFQYFVEKYILPVMVSSAKVHSIISLNCTVILSF